MKMPFDNSSLLHKSNQGSKPDATLPVNLAQLAELI